MIRRALLRWTLITHRYLGIAVGGLMVIWCLSGAVMLYVPYPQLTETERVRHLQPIRWSACCTLPAALTDGPAHIQHLQIEQIGTDAILRARYDNGATGLIDLTAGVPLASLTGNRAASVAARYVPGEDGFYVNTVSQIDYDQWTVQLAHRVGRPLFRFVLHDDAGTEVYVSDQDGRAVQLTTARLRFWNWLGAIPHWLYFTPLRAHPAAWARTVVAISTLGCFLTLTGLVAGVVQMNRSRPGRWTPYAGFHYWHHLLGLIFGLFILTWIASGLVSMNPWGLFESSEFDEPGRLAGGPIRSADVSAALHSLAKSRLPALSVESAPLAGVLYLIATYPDGSRVRLDAQGRERPLTQADLDSVTRSVDPQTGGYSLERIATEDAYYFTHHREQAILPALRLTTRNPAGSRYYLDAVSAQIRAKFDPAGRRYRWWYQGLHRWDFAAALRSRPLWDIVSLTLLGGVTMACAIGTWLSLRASARGG